MYFFQRVLLQKQHMIPTHMTVFSLLPVRCSIDINDVIREARCDMCLASPIKTLSVLVIYFGTAPKCFSYVIQYKVSTW